MLPPSLPTCLAYKEINLNMGLPASKHALQRSKDLGSNVARASQGRKKRENCKGSKNTPHINKGEENS
eukprot:1147956-Pelagomonas_calceolata.AAC.1